jgi:hypothetical protein
MKSGREDCDFVLSIMELNSYYSYIIALFQKQYSFGVEDIDSIETLTSINNIHEEVNELNELLHKGEIEKIRNSKASVKKTTYDDYTYILLRLKTKSFVLCIWDSNELNDNPYVERWKLLENIEK